MGYQVSTPVFEGPFDLLLHLVTRQQVDIWELSVSSIVDDYVATLEQMQALDLAVATEFLLIAAVLLELKARRLLPEPAGDETEEELALWEERDLLLARLLECKTFKDASSAMSRLMQEAERSLPRRAGLEERFIGLTPDPLDGVGAHQLRKALLKLLAPKPVPVVNTDHVAPVRASVADTLQDLLELLPQEGRTTFRRLTEGLHERLEVIVYFLALLELYKRGAVDLEQGGRLAELHVSWIGLPEPAAAAWGSDEVMDLALDEGRRAGEVAGDHSDDDAKEGGSLTAALAGLGTAVGVIDVIDEYQG
ncbi:MAG TPA: ScpA family protein [Acidimicrobiales bacterium]|nr:ScpA family protein [Acidimicrobiales bacterium]